MQCTFEIWLDGQWRECCTVEIRDPVLGGAGAAMLDYDPEYAFGQAVPVALGFPVTLNLCQLPQWPAFLYDLVPQGKGRHYLLGELGIADGPAADWPLLCAGAFNPIGRLRVKEAVAFYQQHVQGQDHALLNRGFRIDEIVERAEEFIEHLQIHGMLSAGTPGVQGAAPKFMLTQAKDGLWYADGALPDDRAQKHYLVKLPRGRDPSDIQILRNEAAFLRVARHVGLHVEELPELREDMLFIPRFDRRVGPAGVERLHQESAASLLGQPGFDVRPSQNEVLAALRRHATDPGATTIEFIKRDVLNLAMGNTDNHARNTAVQIVDGQTRLTPLFDFAPMNLDKEGIARTLRWKYPDKREITNWTDVLQVIHAAHREQISPGEMTAIRADLHAFADALARLPDTMAQHGVSHDIIEHRYRAINTQEQQLRELGAKAFHG